MKKFNSKSLVFPLLALLGLLLLIGVCRAEANQPAIAVYSGDELLGVVKDRATAQRAIQKVCLDKKRTSGQDVDIQGNIEYRSTIVDKREILTETEFRSLIADKLRFSVKAACIDVNGKTVAVVRDEKTARRVLDSLLKQYSTCQEGEKVVSAAFKESVEVTLKPVPMEKIVEYDRALEILKAGTEAPVTYRVKEGDSLWLIARRHNTRVAQIKAANGLESEALQPGQELKIYTSEPYVHVVAVVEGSRKQKIPYQTKVITDRSSSSVRIKQEGKEGEKQVTYRSVRENGKEVKREVLEERILAQAVDRIIVKGQQVQLASRGGSGILSWPLFGAITSYFGSRGGSHTGIDINGRTGDPIRAADDGTVIFAGRSGGYGLMVDISHGNGIVTRYAHCSSILVSVGEHVEKGQVIARVGSTGRSTGSHLHFEVVSNGKQRNPLSYLR